MALSTPATIAAAAFTTATGSTTATTPSFTPAANALLKVNVSGLKSGAVATFSISDSAGLTWTKQQEASSAATFGHTLAVFTAPTGASPAAMTVTITASASESRWNITADQITDDSGSVPTVAQSAQNTGTAATLTVTLAGSPSSTSTILGVVSMAASSGGMPVPGTGFTEQTEVVGAGPTGSNTVLQTQYDDGSADTTCDWSGMGTTNNLGIALEIAEPGGGGSSDTPVTPGIGTLALAGYAPTVTATTNASITPAPGTLTLAGNAPTVTAAANVSVTPGPGTLTLIGYRITIPEFASGIIARLTRIGIRLGIGF